MYCNDSGELNNDGKLWKSSFHQKQKHKKHTLWVLNRLKIEIIAN